MSINKKCTIIEIVADYIYFVITGTEHEIKTFCKTLEKTDTKNKFISLRIDVPISFACDKLEKTYGKINIETGTESAQSYAFAQDSYIVKNRNDSDSIFNKRSHMLMCLEYRDDSINLRFPTLELQDQDDPEQVVLSWVRTVSGKVSKTLQKTIKPISTVGFNDDILVYTAKV